ncbi:MAG: UvrD-helicase domain-containing protein [Bacteroidales bacterium]|nr:UvrD-helicase domain-containing protein [Bacteroidales bacterium]
MMENKDNKILEGLDSQQRQAVSCTEGPVLIVAGAGSGKTRVLTSRIAYILSGGEDPSRILALTFTKKAAGEMKERIAVMVGERKARRLYMGTFHSVFIRFLREFAERIGYPSAFTIYDTGDSTSAIKRCIKELGLDDKVYKPKDVLARISMAKNNLVTAERYMSDTAAKTNDAHAKKPRICDIYMRYQGMMRAAGVMDFDDILLNMNILLRDCPEALESIRSRFDYIMVDEYQDTNFSQYLILKKLSEVHKNLCVVGDDSQSIYAFRGAKIENILNFRKDYPQSQIFRLEQNYRSTQTIVEAANTLISRNEGRIPKNCFSKGDPGDKIRLIQAYTEQEEAMLIASSIISTMQERHCEYQDFAILYRTNSQSRALEEALRKRNLPYIIYSGNSFFDRAEVKDMMAYFKLVVNVNDDESFRRVINTPARGIGDTSVEALSQAAKAAGCSLLKAAYLENQVLEANGLRNAAIVKIRQFCDMIARFNERYAGEDAYKIASELSDAAGLYRFFKEDNSIESQSRASNIEELVNSVKGYVEDKHNEFVEELMTEGTVSDASEIPESDFPVETLGGFLEDISLLSAVDMGDDEDSNNKIALMTVHSAKGLEFPYVFVAGMEENLFPSGGMLASPQDIEEERRLFYVAMTRAKVAVQFSFAQTRMRNGKHESNSPSRFIREIDPKYIENPLRREIEVPFGVSGMSARGMAPQYGAGRQSSGGQFSGPSGRRFSGPSGGQYQRPISKPEPVHVPSNLKPVRSASAPAPRKEDPNFVPTPVLQLKEGMRIEHNKFGFGKILEISGPAADLKAKISFDDYGEKILLLKYAKIRTI